MAIAPAMPEISDDQINAAVASYQNQRTIRPQISDDQINAAVNQYVGRRRGVALANAQDPIGPAEVEFKRTAARAVSVPVPSGAPGHIPVGVAPIPSSTVDNLPSSVRRRLALKTAQQPVTTAEVVRTHALAQRGVSPLAPAPIPFDERFPQIIEKPAEIGIRNAAITAQNINDAITGTHPKSIAKQEERRRKLVQAEAALSQNLGETPSLAENVTAGVSGIAPVVGLSMLNPAAALPEAGGAAAAGLGARALATGLNAARTLAVVEPAIGATAPEGHKVEAMAKNAPALVAAPWASKLGGRAGVALETAGHPNLARIAPQVVSRAAGGAMFGGQAAIEGGAIPDIAASTVLGAALTGPHPAEKPTPPPTWTVPEPQPAAALPPARPLATLAGVERKIAENQASEKLASALPKAAPAAEKEPWQMTKGEFKDSGMVGIFPHETIVRRAMQRGESVPPEVLAEYPDLQKGALPPAPAPQPESALATESKATTEPPAAKELNQIQKGTSANGIEIPPATSRNANESQPGGAQVVEGPRPQAGGEESGAGVRGRGQSAGASQEKVTDQPERQPGAWKPEVSPAAQGKVAPKSEGKFLDINDEPKISTIRFPESYVKQVRLLAEQRIAKDADIRQKYEKILGRTLTDSQVADIAVEIMQQQKELGEPALIQDGFHASDWSIERAWGAIVKQKIHLAAQGEAAPGHEGAPYSNRMKAQVAAAKAGARRRETFRVEGGYDWREKLSQRRSGAIKAAATRRMRGLNDMNNETPANRILDAGGMRLTHDELGELKNADFFEGMSAIQRNKFAPKNRETGSSVFATRGKWSMTELSQRLVQEGLIKEHSEAAALEFLKARGHEPQLTGKHEVQKSEGPSDDAYAAHYAEQELRDAVKTGKPIKYEDWRENIRLMAPGSELKPKGQEPTKTVNIGDLPDGTQVEIYGDKFTVVSNPDSGKVEMRDTINVEASPEQEIKIDRVVPAESQPPAVKPEQPVIKPEATAQVPPAPATPEKSGRSTEPPAGKIASGSGGFGVELGNEKRAGQPGFSPRPTPVAGPVGGVPEGPRAAGKGESRMAQASSEAPSGVDLYRRAVSRPELASADLGKVGLPKVTLRSLGWKKPESKIFLHRDRYHKAAFPDMDYLGEGDEAIVYSPINRPDIVYKFYPRHDNFAGNGITPEFTVGENGEIRTHLPANNRAVDFIAKSAIIDALGLPTKLIGVTEYGDAIVEQRHIPPDADRNVPYPNSKALALPFDYLPAELFKKPMPIEGIVQFDGKFWYLGDLHSGNVMRTADGRDVILDAMVAEIPQKLVEQVPKLGEYLNQIRAQSEKANEPNIFEQRRAEVGKQPEHAAQSDLFSGQAKLGDIGTPKTDEKLGPSDAPKNVPEMFPESLPKEPAKGKPESAAKQPDILGGGGSGGGLAEQGPLASRTAQSRKRAGRPTAKIAWENTPVELAFLDDIQVAEMPEIVNLVKQLTGNVPNLKTLPKNLGLFHSKDGSITIDWRLFEDPEAAARTLAHELGHAIDWLPDKTIARGNLLGSLLSLRRYMKQTFGTLSNPELRSELKELSRYWKPFDELTSSKGYVRYRDSARELYADFVSVLLNSPGTAQRIAPNFYQAFIENLGSKPDVADAYVRLQELLRQGGPEVISARQSRVRSAFDVAEETRREKLAAKENERTLRQIAAESVTNAKAHFVDVNSTILDAVKGVIGEEDFNALRNDLENRFMADARNHEMARQIKRDVVEPFLKETGIDSAAARTEFGLYLFYSRVASGDRSILANPFGEIPKTARDSLDNMRQRLGEKTYGSLERAMATFRETVERVGEAAVESGVYNREQWGKLDHDTYATFEVIDFIEANLPGTIKAQRGTFREIANPFSSTILKMSTLNRLVAYNIAKGRFVSVWAARFPDEIELSKTHKTPEGRSAGFLPSKNQKLSGRVELFEDGKWVGYDVDPYLAKTFDQADRQGMLRPVMEAISVFNHKVFHPLFVTYSLGFQYANVFRDAMRSLKAGESLSEFTLGRLKSAGAAWARARGIDNKMISEMLQSGALDIPFSETLGVSKEDTYERLLRMLALGEDISTRPNRKGWRKAIVLLDAIKASGDFVEAWSKTTGWWIETQRLIEGESKKWMARLSGKDQASLPKNKRRLRNLLADVLAGKEASIPDGLKKSWLKHYMNALGLKRSAMAYNVRTYKGTPNWRRKGHSTYISNALLMYSNVFKEGLRGDLEVATSPKTRGGYWAKTVLFNLLPKAILAAAVYGLYGDEAKEWAEKQTEYDKTNYTPVPLGFRDDPKGGSRLSVALRIPSDETGRFIGGLFWKMLMLKKHGLEQLPQVLDFGANQLPNTAPAISLATGLAEFLMGKNPIDSFRDSPIVPPRVFDAGQAASLPYVWGWTLQKFGSPGEAARSLFRSWREDISTEEGLETAWKSLSGFSRIIKATNFGETEEEMRLENQEKKINAQFRLTFPQEVLRLVSERSRLIQKKDRKSEKEENRLEDLNGFYSIYVESRKAIKLATEEKDNVSANEIRQDLVDSAKEIRAQGAAQ